MTRRFRHSTRPAMSSLLSKFWQLSRFWARVEIALSASLVAIITALVLMNVVARSMNQAVYWVDELTIYALVWMTFLCASAAVHYSQSVAITFIKDMVPEKAARLMGRLVDVAVFIFALAMVYLCFRWFMPVELMKAGFDIDVFQSASFNFIYNEPTTTLGIKKAWVWSVIWLFSFGVLLHSTCNLFTEKTARQSIAQGSANEGNLQG